MWNRRSIFGSKDKLFERAAERYLRGPGNYMTAALRRPTARKVAEATVHRLAERFDSAVTDGQLSGVDTLVLARWIVAVGQGISVQARSGASRADLHPVAELALAGVARRLGWLEAFRVLGPGSNCPPLSESGPDRSVNSRRGGHAQYAMDSTGHNGIRWRSGPLILR